MSRFSVDLAITAHIPVRITVAIMEGDIIPSTEAGGGKKSGCYSAG
jgi:hypothetical protein